MIPHVESALSDLPELLDEDISAILNGKRTVAEVATASFEIPFGDPLFDRVIEVYGVQAVGDIKYIYFTPKVKKSNGVLQKGKGTWSLNAELFLDYVSN